MNKKNYVAVAALALAMMTSCAGQKEAKSTSGIDLANMDTTVAAGTDFSAMHVAAGTTHIR